MSDSGTEPGREPFFTKEIDAALRDTVVLLQFLGRASDGRLQSHFQDTRDQVAGTSSKKTTPPCKSYFEFLNRLSAIHGRFRKAEGQKDQDWLFELPKEGDPALSDCAFVLWSRDFLAGVAAPATADTVRLTAAYMERRTDNNWLREQWASLIGRHRSRPPAASAPPPTPPPPPHPSPPQPPPAAKTVERAAAKLARRVRFLERLALLVTFVTVGLSIYALSGRLIIAARDDTIKQFRQLEEKITDIETHTANPVIVNQVLQKSVAESVASKTENAKFYLCDNMGVLYPSEDGPKSLPDFQKAPSFGPISNNVFFKYGSYEAIDVCRQRKRVLAQLFALGEQLLAWQRVVTGPWHFGIGSTDMDGKIFGKNDKLTKEFANNPFICFGFTGGTDPGKCQIALTELIEYYGRIPDSILGCITLYILPCLYALLGSMAATMRYLRLRVDTYQINFTDRGRILQNVVLGIIAGAIVGLFSAYLSKSSAVENIGVSAIACLAGYNVSALFRFLDDISDRIFNVAAPTAK